MNNYNGYFVYNIPIFPFGGKHEASDIVLFQRMDKLPAHDWGWDGQLVPLPGFGFFPQRVRQELEDMANVRKSHRIL